MDWDLRVLLERLSLLGPEGPTRETLVTPQPQGEEDKSSSHHDFSLIFLFSMSGTSKPVSVKGYLVNVLGVQITLL